MLNEVSTEVLSPAIRLENFDRGILVHMTPHLEGFVGPEGVAFVAEEMQMGEVGFVVRESDIVTPPPKGFNWGRSPQIGVDFSPKNGSAIPLTSLCDGLSFSLCVDAGVAEKGGFFS